MKIQKKFFFFFFLGGGVGAWVRGGIGLGGDWFGGGVRVDGNRELKLL